MFKQHPNPFVIALMVVLLPLALLASPISEGVNVFGVPAASSGSARLLAETDSYIDVEWTWSQFSSTTISTPSGAFHKLSLELDIPVSRQALGEPQLPIEVEMLRFPRGSYGTVEVLNCEWVTFEDVRPYPVQFPTRDGDETPPFAYDAAAYTSVETIPPEMSGVTTPKGWGGLEVGSLWASPFRYTPAIGQLDVATSITVRVWFHRDDQFHALASASPSPWLTKAQRAGLLNPPLDPPAVDDFDEPEPVRLLVVTRQAALQTAQPLIDLHKNTGLKTEIWVLNGNVADVDIKDRIRDMYADGLQQVLFIGDGDEATPDIPMHFWDDDYPGVQFDPPDAAGSDSWYTCLDGADRDGYTDHLPDISLGRLVYSNNNALNQLAVQIQKTTDYIAWQFQDQDSDWLRRGILIGHKQNDPNHDYIPCKRTIATRNYPFEHPVWDTLFGNAQGSNNARMLELVNEGLGVFNYRGHGSETIMADWNHAEDINAARVAEMNNRQHPFILISSACLTGDIYEYTGNGGQCLMESFQKHAGGGSLATNGCTITTFTLGNSYCDIAIFDAFYDDGIFNIGYAANAATVSTVLYFDANAPNNWRGIGYVNMRAYLWLGDAAIDLRYANPARLTIDAPGLVPDGAQQLEISVTSEGEPFEGATITARTLDDQVYAIAFTDEQGNATLFFDAPLERQQALTINASHHEAKPASQPVLVANGMGVVEGTVVKASSNEAVAGASVDLVRFHVVAVTDENGAFRIEGIPSGEYDFVASVRGMIAQTIEVNVVENMIANAAFELTQSRMVIDIDTVSAGLEVNSEIDLVVGYSNEGDAPLEWTVEFQPSVRQEPFAQIMEFLPGWDNGDERIYGAVFTGDKFYVAGGNNAQDPNYIYVFNREGLEIREERFEQSSASSGFRDLDWDGQYLYGAATDEIKVMTLDGDVVETIMSPYDPSRALAVDPEGNIWVGNNRSNVVKINRDGDILASIPVNFFVMGLAWYPDQKDGNTLLMWGRAGVTGVELYAANPVTGRTTLIQDFPENEGESAIEGLSVTNEYDARDWMMIGMVGDDATRTLKLSQLDPRSDWLALDPLFGSLDPNEEGEINFKFSAHNYRPETILTGNILISTNNQDEVIALPIEVSVSPSAVEPTTSTPIPSSFALARVYPNPFNAMLKVEVSLPESGLLDIGIYDLQGRLVSGSHSSYFEAGNHTLALNGEGLANGLYIIRAASRGKTAIAKAALLK